MPGATISNQSSGTVYGIVSRKDLPNAPSGTTGYEIIEIKPGQSSPSGLDVDGITETPPTLRPDGTLHYDTDVAIQKYPNSIIFDNTITVVDGPNWPSGGTPTTVGGMNGNTPIDDPNGYPVTTYPTPPPRFEGSPFGPFGKF